MDFIQAKDEIVQRFKEDWDALAPAVVGLGSPPVVHWPDVNYASLPPVDAHWARLTVLWGADAGSTIGEAADRRFWRTGIVAVQVFSPLVDEGLIIGERLAKIARNAFERKRTPGGAWFRDLRVLHVGETDGWRQINVTADVEFEEAG